MTPATVQLPAHALQQEGFQESRMWENYKSGSTRGEWVASRGVALSPTLPRCIRLGVATLRRHASRRENR